MQVPWRGKKGTWWGEVAVFIGNRGGAKNFLALGFVEDVGFRSPVGFVRVLVFIPCNISLPREP